MSTFLFDIGILWIGGAIGFLVAALMAGNRLSDARDELQRIKSQQRS
jgi:gas vesicle protein